MGLISDIYALKYKRYTHKKVKHKRVFKGTYRLRDKIGTMGLVYWGKVTRKGTQAMTCMLECPECKELFRDYMWRAVDNKISMCKDCRNKNEKYIR